MPKGINDVMGLTIDLAANTERFVKDLRAAADKVDIGFDTKLLVKQFAGSQSQIQKVFSSTVADAATSGFSKANIQGLTRKLEVAAEKSASSHKRLLDLSNLAHEAQAKKQSTRLIQDEMALEAVKLKGLEERFKEEQKGTDKLMGQRKKAMKEAAKTLEKTHLAGVTSAGVAAETFGSGIEKAFSNLKSGNVAGIFKSAGGAASKGGKAAAEKAGKGGAGAGMMGGIGKILSTVGPALAAIGAIAAGLAAVVAVVVAADSAMKGLNKTLMSSGASGADLSDQYGILGDTMDRIRDTFTGALSFNRLWGTTAKDHLEILGAYAGAGLTFKEMAVGVKDAGGEMDHLREYTAAALTYSKLLGMSTQEVSSTMASYMEELGLTLKGVRTRFSNLTAAAKESGFSTKRFFNMVLQATSGMSMYNVRLEEAAGLLIHLSKILGEKMGGDFLQNLMKGFKDEDTQTRVKKTMTTGIPLSRRVLKKDAINSAKEFARKLKDIGEKDQGEGDAITALLKKFKLDPTKAKEFAQKLGEMSTENLGMLSSQLGSRGGASAGLSRSAVDLATQGKAFQGGLGGVQAARASAGGGASLFLQLNEAQKVLGKSLDQIDLSNVKQRMAFESITGKSGEAAEQLRRVGMDLRGQYNTIQKAKKGGQAAIDEYNETLSKQFGVRIGEKDQMQRIVKGPGGEESYEDMGEKLDDFFLSFGDKALSDVSGQESEDTLLAQEIAARTTDMAKVLEQGVEVLLRSINKSVLYIAGVVGFGLKGEEKEAKGKVVAELGAEIMDAQKQAQLQSRKIRDLTTARRKKGLSSEQIAEIDRKIEGHTEARATAQREAAGKQKGLHAISRISDADEIVGSASSASAWRGAAAGASREGNLEQLKKSMGPAWDAHMARIAGEAATEAAEIVGARKKTSIAARMAKAMARRRSKPGGASKEDLEAEILARKKDELLASKGMATGSRAGVASGLVADVGLGQTLGSDKALGDKLGEFHLKKKTEEDARDKKHLTKSQKQRLDAAKLITTTLEEIEKNREVKELASLMASSGVGGGARALQKKAEAMLTRGSTHGLDLERKTYDYESGTERRLGDILRGKAGLKGGLGIQKKMEAPTVSPPMGDMLMQIDERGQIKHIVPPARGDETTAVATKPGGAVRGAGKLGGGGGGNVTTVNVFGDAQQVVRVLKRGYEGRVLN